MICVDIDELTPCLRDAESGALIDTEAIRIKRKSFLDHYNKKTGWHVDWSELLQDHEVYALVLRGTVRIQGMVALRLNKDQKAVYIAWMVASPENNPLIAEKKKYSGVGGHLFAIAINRSCELNCSGDVYGYAANYKLLKHYVEKLGATYLGLQHQFHFMIVDNAAKSIVEVYDYDNSRDEL